MKIYNSFTDIYGNVYKFDNYMDFATFWFSHPHTRRVKYFGDNFKKLQHAAANSKEARTPMYK